MNEWIDEHTALRLFEALDDGRLDELFQADHIDYAERETLALTRIKLGLPREAVVHLMGSIRRAQGLTVLAGSWGDYAGWVTLSAELVELLHEIDVRSTFDFHSSSGLPEDEIRHLKNQILIEEVLSLGLTAGELSPADEGELAAAKGAGRRMLREGAAPATEYERWVLRFFEMMQRLPELASEPLTINRLRDLHAQLVLDETYGGVYRTVTIDSEGARAGTLPERISSEMNAIAAYGSASQKPFVHPLIKTIVYFYWIRRVRPFAVANGLFARVIAHIYEYQQGYRSLPFTPLTRTASDVWAAEPAPANVESFDATAFVIERLNVFLGAYVAAELEIEAAARRSAALRTRFRRLDINLRQSRILDKALAVPTTVFTIKRHARSWSLAYETARQDFLQLVSVGYLEQTKRGRVYEFRLAKDAERKLLPLLSR